MQEANDVIRSVELGQALGDSLILNLDLCTRDVVAFLIFNQIVADLHVLSDEEVLLLEDFVLLRRLQLEDSVFDLRGKITEHEVVCDHQLLQAFGGDLEFKREVVLDRRDLS